MSVEKTKQAIAKVTVRPMSPEVVEVRKNINMIQEAMANTMKPDVHFGTIPGCQKPSLYKAGAEVIMGLFKLSSDPIITDLSQGEEIRYQLKVNVTTREGVFVGAGIGECSSKEEKYMWRASICEEEFESFAEHMRRIKFKKGYRDNPVSKVQQVRVNPSDMANTILKMAKKRALIDAVLTATGASDIFFQDLEDLPEGYSPPEVEESSNVSRETSPEPEKKEEPKRTGDIISEPQRKRLFAIAMGAGMDKDGFSEWLSFTFEYGSSKDITRADYEEICTAAGEYKK